MAVRDTVRIAGTLIADSGRASWMRAKLSVTAAALDGEIATGSVYVLDQANREFDGGRAVIITYHDTGVDEQILMSGYLGEQTRDRPEDQQNIGNRGNMYTVQDGNALLAHRRINKWVRPAETDVARIKALCDDYFPELDYTDFVPNTNTAMMPKKKYADTFADEVFQDVMEQTGKTWFVDSQGLRRLHYHKLKEDVGFNAPISIVADGTANLTDEFPPIMPNRRQDPYELANDIRITGSRSKHITVTDSASITAHDADDLKHQDALQFDSNDTTILTNYANSVLADRKDERPSI